MKGRNVLPYTDENGYYEVRMESIGGLGANLAGKMLAELGALYMGLNASSFSSYGSEKKGSPVRAYVRFMENGGQILRNAPVHNPHLLAIFHEALMQRYPVFAGTKEESVTIVNTQSSKGQMEKLCSVKGELICLDAAGIARECGCRLNMVMLGAMTAASGFLDKDKLETLLTESLGKKYPDQLKRNLDGIRGGYEAAEQILLQLRQQQAEGEKKIENVEKLLQSPAGCGLCAMEEPYSGGFTHGMGGVNCCPGNTAENDLSSSREGFIPVFHPEKCIHCGLCDTTCPDMVFRFEKGVWKQKETLMNKGPVYQYCKGCLRCVEICPVAALTTAEEKKYRQKNSE